MTDNPAPEAASHPLNHPVWAQLRETIHEVTGWRTALLDAEGRVFAHQTPARDPVGISPALAEVARRQCALCAPGVALVPGESGPRLRWVVAPLVTAGVAVGALVAGGLPAAEDVAEGPSISAADAAEATRRLAGLVDSITDLYTALPQQTEAIRSRYLAERGRAEALYRLSTLVASTLEIGPIVALLVTQTRALFGADRAAVFLRNEAGEMHGVNAVGLSPEYLEAVGRFYQQAAGGRALATGQTVYIADATRDKTMGPLRKMARAEGFCSMVITPLIHQGAAVGALALYHDAVHSYTDEDIAALTTFANQAAVALANARLFEESGRQVRRAKFLADMGRLLNSSLDMGQVLNSLTRAATEVLGEACAIYLLQRNDEALRLTAYADTRPGPDRERFRYLDARPPRLGESGIGAAALRGEMRLVEAERPAADGGPDPYLRAFGAHSYLVAPLVARDRLVGALVVWLFNPSIQFTPDDIQLTQAMAPHAAIALENARLYQRELHAQQAKDEFLSSVSHELRTPLTAILGYTQLMRKSAEDAPGRFQQQINIIWSQAQRLNRLVETILDISSIEQGQLNLNLERLDLWSVAMSALDRQRASSRPGLAFALGDAGTAAWVMGDRARLEQVFGHLIANAIKYSPKEGTVRIDMGLRDSRATVRIADEGPGMTEAQLAELFQRYYQGDTPLNRTGGLGLGLYISRAIIEEHGGSLQAESSQGGATFLVSLPAEAGG
jgi:signal transduction histidine kinase